MQVVIHPQALPATCMFCPGSVRDRYIDTDYQIEFHGAVYICDECVVSMGRMIGMLSKEQAEHLIQENTETSSRMFHLQRRQAALEASINDLALAGYDRFRINDRGDLFAHLADSNETVPAPTRTGPSRPSATKASVGSGAGATPEPSDDKELGVVHSNERSTTDGGFRI